MGVLFDLAALARVVKEVSLVLNLEERGEGACNLTSLEPSQALGTAGSEDKQEERRVRRSRTQEKAHIHGITSEEVTSPHTFQVKPSGARGGPSVWTRRASHILTSPSHPSQPQLHSPITGRADWFINHHLLIREFINLLTNGKNVSALDRWAQPPPPTCPPPSSTHDSVTMRHVSG